MEEAIKPPRKHSLIFNLSLGFAALVGALTLLILGSGTAARAQNLLFIILAVVLLGVAVLLGYRVFLVLTTSYQVTRSSLELHWGFQREIIPLDRVEWAHPVSDFDSPMPLPGFILPFQYYGKRFIRGLGMVAFAATDRQSLVLIRADERHFVISPADPRGFAQDFESLSSQGVTEAVEAVSENARTRIGEIFQDGMAKKLFASGVIGLLILALVTIALSATRPTITWITLEQVSSNRLLLLLLIGALDWLLNTLLGGYCFLRGLLEKRWIFLIWSWSGLVSLILAAAAVFMSIGSA